MVSNWHGGFQILISADNRKSVFASLSFPFGSMPIRVFWNSACWVWFQQGCQELRNQEREREKCLRYGSILPRGEPRTGAHNIGRGSPMVAPQDFHGRCAISSLKRPESFALMGSLTIFILCRTENGASRMAHSCPEMNPWQ